MAKEWTMNDTQKGFVEDLKAIGRPISLKELNALTNKDYKSGSINTLITKNIVTTDKGEMTYKETKEFTFVNANGENVVVTEVTNKTIKNVSLYSYVPSLNEKQ